MTLRQFYVTGGKPLANSPWPSCNSSVIRQSDNFIFGFENVSRNSFIHRAKSDRASIILRACKYLVIDVYVFTTNIKSSPNIYIYMYVYLYRNNYETSSKSWKRFDSGVTRMENLTRSITIVRWKKIYWHGEFWREFVATRFLMD